MRQGEAEMADRTKCADQMNSFSKSKGVRMEKHVVCCHVVCPAPLYESLADSSKLPYKLLTSTVAKGANPRF